MKSDANSTHGGMSACVPRKETSLPSGQAVTLASPRTRPLQDAEHRGRNEGCRSVTALRVQFRGWKSVGSRLKLKRNSSGVLSRDVPTVADTVSTSEWAFAALTRDL